MPIFHFHTLWNNHPTIKGDSPLLDVATYRNQCAINLSASLIRSGVPLKDFRGALSWQKNKEKYAIRAQELADWLNSRPRFPCSFEKISSKNFEESIKQKVGIIFFKNYWGVGNQGDHIDLWNSSRLTDWKSWPRIRLGISWPGVWTDYHKAEEVWFWRI
jgi:hypothetical protein